mmetsp:Transcript_11543/g.25877  ORF Transcript_11543/g.25877 Transcript_11543/m.25877 type:complete len:113 (+) Transcript_11543:608-946(+)
MNSLPIRARGTGAAAIDKKNTKAAASRDIRDRKRGKNAPGLKRVNAASDNSPASTSTGQSVTFFPRWDHICWCSRQPTGLSANFASLRSFELDNDSVVNMLRPPESVKVMTR